MPALSSSSEEQPAPRPSLWSIPNLLSLGRVAFTPVMVWLLTFPGRGISALVAGLFLIACLTDWLDGYLARRDGIITNLGKFLDPLADKILILSGFIMLAAMPRDPIVPAWMVALIAAREIAVTGLRAIASDEGVVLGAEHLGKAKTTMQTIALFSLMVHYPYGPLDFHAAGMAFLWIALILSLWSGIAYHVRFVQILRARG
ncbi:MAG: CDP-diacylglycerol--glycerol-3-phosphate 3-phosphatidyltransferase [Deltaproteobacteria bacterium]